MVGSVARKAFQVLLLVVFVLICGPLITPVAMGGVFAILCWPLALRLERFKMPERGAALLLTAGFSVLVLLPVTLLVIFSARSGLDLFKRLQTKWQVVPPLAPGDDWAAQLAAQPWFGRWVAKLGRVLPVDASELLSTAADAVKLAGVKLGEMLGVFLGKVPGVLLAIAVVIVSLYFFLADGRRFVRFVRSHSVFEPRDTEELMERLAVMSRTVILASVLAGLVQALIMFIGMLSVGFSNAGLLAFIVFVSSFIPLVGSSPVTLIVAFVGWMQLGGNAGVVLLVSSLLTSLADNVVRPWVLKGGADLHPLMGFVAAFGGLQLLGLSGLFLGPIVAGLFLTVLRLHQRQ
jgi:predicted PurR-regulated permease PerM